MQEIRDIKQSTVIEKWFSNTLSWQSIPSDPIQYMNHQAPKRHERKSQDVKFDKRIQNNMTIVYYKFISPGN